MFVNSVQGLSNPQFKRKPNSLEMKRYSQAVGEGLKVLGKDAGLIIHNSSVPSMPKNNIGIGSLLSKNAEKFFIPFLAAIGFTSIQQDPDNIRGKNTSSPYSPQSTAKNIYMIPIERLASDEYGNLIEQEDIKNIIQDNAKRKDANSVDYNKTAENFENVLSKAYSALINDKDEFLLEGMNEEDRMKHIQLLDEFEQYKLTKGNNLEPMAVYEILSKQNNDEDWHTWSKEQRNLYTSEDKKPLETFIKKNAADIDYFMFKQWLVERETAQANERNEKLGISVIGDSPVAFTPVEVWMNQDLFMDGWALGCPPDFFSKYGQRWGFPVVKPETIFNKDGSLGKGGKFMKEHYEKLFESSPGGARIDHIIGLIDPFVYATKESKMNDSNSRRLYSSPQHPVLGKYAKFTKKIRKNNSNYGRLYSGRYTTSTKEPRMNKNNSGRLYSSPYHPLLGKYAKYTKKQYASILEKIVFPAAAKYGLSKEDIICEDLGTVTKPVRKVMKQLNLSGISVTQFDYRGKDQPAKNIIMPGSHDNESYIEYTNNIFQDEARLEEKTQKLAEDTSVPDEDRVNYKRNMKTDKSRFMSASFAELFTSPAKKIQLFFTTFFGIGKTYNKPGLTEGCWTLRLPENFEEMYWENVKNGTAVNFPEAIARAIRNKGKNSTAKHQDLLKNLDEFTKILKE